MLLQAPQGLSRCGASYRRWGPKSAPAHRAGTAARIGRRITSLAAIGRADRDLISCTGSKSDSGATELLPSDFVGYRILPLEIA